MRVSYSCLVCVQCPCSEHVLVGSILRFAVSTPCSFQVKGKTYKRRHGCIHFCRQFPYVCGVLETAVDREAFGAVKLVMQHLVAIIDKSAAQYVKQCVSGYVFRL